MIFGNRFSGSTVLLPDLHRSSRWAAIRSTPKPRRSPPRLRPTAPRSSTCRRRRRAGGPPRRCTSLGSTPTRCCCPTAPSWSWAAASEVSTASRSDEPSCSIRASETWTDVATEATPRAYHSAAVLLPDGRVLSSGHGPRPVAAAPARSTRRPTCSTVRDRTSPAAPSAVGYGSSFSVASPEAATIATAALMRPGSATHAVNFDQRYVGLTFGPAGGPARRARRRADGAVAPPGLVHAVPGRRRGRAVDGGVGPRRFERVASGASSRRPTG